MTGSRLFRLIALAALVVAAAALWWAATPVGRDGSTRADEIAAALRCPTCQGTSVADSPSRSAAGMRHTIERLLADGHTEEEIRQYFVERYGEWVLLSPRPVGFGIAVWLLPAAVLALGSAVIVRKARRGETRRDDTEMAPETADLLGADHTAGRLDLGEGTAAEELDAALLLYTELRGEPIRSAGDERLRAARCRLAVAHQAWELQQSASPSTHDAAAGPEPTAKPGRTHAALGRGTVLVAAALVTAIMALGAAVVPRAPGQPATGSIPDGLAAPEASVERDPHDADAHLALGRAYDERGELASAIAAYRRALELRPDDPVARFLLAFGLARTGQEPDALALLERLHAERPGDPDVLLLLGSTQLSVDLPTGRDTLRRFLQLAPEHPAAAQVRRLIAREDGR